MGRKKNPNASPVASPWAALAEHWKLLESPLRPLPEDLARLQSAWHASLPDGPPRRSLDILILGVTPEFALFPWAPAQELTAVDSSEVMIRAVWPGDTPGRKALHGDWLQLPFPDGSFDLVVSDNAPTLFTGLPRLGKFSRELRRVLRPTGRVVMRNLERPAQPEAVEDVVADAGRERNFHAFKMRFLMALQGDDAATGVELAAGWRRFQELCPDRAELAARIGCSVRVVAMIDAYRDRDARYSFYSLPEMARGFTGFKFTPGPAGHYPFAGHCPVFALAPEP